MTGTGRRPYDTIEATRYGVPNSRLKPPPDLPEPQKRAFLDLVAKCPASQFQPADVELICRWSESVVTARTAQAELAAAGMVGADGKPSPWVAIYQQAVRNQALLALRLRVGPQSRQPRAPKTKPVAMSYYDLQNLDREDGEGKDTPPQ
jgi:hypothetical protein